MPIHPDHKSMHDSMIKKHGAKKGKQIFFATMKKRGLNPDQPRLKKSKEMIYVHGITYKEEGEDFFVEGFISTSDPDNNHLIGTGDFPEVIQDQQDLVNQLNNNPQASLLSIHHDWIKGEGSRPIGVRVDKAEVKLHPETNAPGAYVKYKLNKAHKEFDNTKS